MVPYYASMVIRWHTNEHLSRSGDNLASHGGRMAILALMFWPDCDKWLLVQCATHDLGEYVTGDIPFGARNKDHEEETGALIDMGMYFSVKAPDFQRLKFLDSLDAHLWAQHHAPHILTREDWQDQRKKILATADELGVSLADHGITI